MKIDKKIIIVTFIFFIIIRIYPAIALSSTTKREEIVSALFKSVEEWMGTPYLLGGTTYKGVDCSAFVGNVYRKVFNINLPRSVAQQMNVGKLVKRNFQPGDLIFFLINGKISHVGIYVFDNKFIHAASAGPQTGVIKSSLDEPYYKKHFVFARRIIELPTYSNQKESKIVKEIKKDSHKNIHKKVTNNTMIKSADIMFARVFFRGKLHDIREDYYQDETIYFKVTVNSDNKANLFLVLQNKESNKDIKKIALVVEPRKENYFVIKLKKGSYNVLLKDSKENLFTTKSLLIQ